MTSDDTPTAAPATRPSLERETVVVLAVVTAAILAGCQPSPVTRLFDGRTLAGWEGDTTRWRVAAGAIVGGKLGQASDESAYLCTIASYDDFVLRLHSRLTGEANGGVTFRSQRVPGSTEVAGYQADMGFIAGGVIALLSDTKPADTLAPYPLWGSLLDHFRPDSGRYPDSAVPVRLIAVPARGLVDSVYRSVGWNEVVVTAIGPRIAIQLNGVTTLDYYERGRVARQGRICLQTHSGPPSEAWYKDISIQPIRSATSKPPT